MIFSIDDFRAATDFGFLTPDRYRVRFPIPPAMANTYKEYTALYNTNRYLEFYSDSVDFAGVGLATHNVVRYGYGASEKKPIAPIFNDVMFTFYNDTESMNYHFFELWMNIVSNFNMSKGIDGVINPGSVPYEMYYKDDYAVDSMVTLIDNNANEVATWRYRQMFPIDIPHIKLGWGIIQDVMRATVVFSFTDKYIDTDLGGSLITATTESESS